MSAMFSHHGKEVLCDRAHFADAVNEDAAITIADGLNRHTCRPFGEWHEGYGNVLWWKSPVTEPPFSGTPLDSDWPYQPSDVCDLWWQELVPPFLVAPMPDWRDMADAPHDGTEIVVLIEGGKELRACYWLSWPGWREVHKDSVSVGGLIRPKAWRPVA